MILRARKGFTLLELLLAITITAVIGSAITMSISQLFSVNAADEGRMDAVKQVENALHYINRDAQMASTIAPTGNDFPLVLTWNEWDVAANSLSGPLHTVTYSINAANQLKREEQIGAAPATSLFIADHISVVSDCSINADIPPVLTVNLTASIGGFRPVSEARTLEVRSRPEALMP
jgi:prepilin-type N-terminal cleavage/methylation domain-containing protein